MANYTKLKSDITSAIKTNGVGAITGDRLQQVLLAVVEALGLGYQFAGVATMDSTPTTAAAQIPRFWLAAGKGRYTNYGALYLTADISVITWTPNGDTGIYAQTGVYTKPKTLPVLELLDVTMWAGGYSGGVKEYITDNQLNDGAMFPIRIDVTGNDSQLDTYVYVGVATYDVLHGAISATLENCIGRVLNVTIVAGNNERVFFTAAGNPSENSSNVGVAVPISWGAEAGRIIGYEGELQVGREVEANSAQWQALQSYEANSVVELPAADPLARYVFGTLELSDGSVDSASCFVVCDYGEGSKQYGYAIEN